MTRDEAMKVWRNAFLAFFTNGAVDPNSRDEEAAATVIQQAFAERDGEIERRDVALKTIRDDIAKRFKTYSSGGRQEHGCDHSTAMERQNAYRMALLIIGRERTYIRWPDRVAADADRAEKREAARQALAAKGDSRG